MQTYEVFSQTKYIMELQRMMVGNEGVKRLRGNAIKARNEVISRFLSGEKKWTESYMGRIRESKIKKSRPSHNERNILLSPIIKSDTSNYFK